MKRIYNNTVLFLSLLFSFFPEALKKIIWCLIEPFGGYFFSAIRVGIVKSSSSMIGNDVYIGKYTEIRSSQHLKIGDRVSIQRNCYIDAAGGVIIGNDVSIAHASSLISFDHSYCYPDLMIRQSPANYKSICIGSDVWIACGVRILSGVEIGNRVIIAAGGVCSANANYKKSAIYAGVPAKLIKSLC